MTRNRLRVRATSLTAIAAALIFSGAASCQDITADVLIKEFYKWYPCVSPNPAMDMARNAPDILHSVFDSSRSKRDRFAAYQLVVGARLPGYKQVIKTAMSDRSSDIQASAVHHLHLALPQKQLIKEYIRLLGDSSCVMRYYGAEQLAERPSKQAVEPLFKLLADESIETRHRAASTLLAWNDVEIKRKLRDLSRSDDVTIAGVAACSLAWACDAPVNIVAIHSYLEQQLMYLTGPANNGAGHVTPIIALISHQGDRSSLAVLQSAANHKNRSVQEAARDAIARITNRTGR